MVKLDPVKAGGPYEMKVTVGDSASVAYKNVLVGEVWVCSGQSNMEMSLRGTSNAQEAIAGAGNPKIRLFTVSKAQADSPQIDCKGKWQECTAETVPGFSAVGYHFGREVQAALDVPVGLIHTSWGGTPVEAWMSVQAQQGDSDMKAVFGEYAQRQQAFDKAMADYQAATVKHKVEQEKATSEGKAAPPAPKKPGGPGWKPTVLYNAMICPIVPYAIGGAIWYQGESNAGNAVRYRKQFPAMIRNWREDWSQGDFPFLFVQLANFMKREDQPSDPDWAWLREAQTMTLSTPKTGMAVIIDIGDSKDIHPKNKADVGKRLALAARSVAYGQKIVYSGPMYDSMKVEGGKVRLTFKHVGGGLVGKDGQTLKGFAIAGTDRKFVWADAKIDGDTVVVSSGTVAQPVAVRYAWANDPECNLYNKEGLPASPFRTDDWPRQTAK
jgi:sialate O-acetylesterase